MIKTEREFAKMCSSRGFIRRAQHYYARCIGDGVYQTIYTGFKKYIDTNSPNYTPENRKSNYISIALRSMYSCHAEHVFADERDSGGFTPADLCSGHKYSGPFHGVKQEYDYMEQTGFDLLDTINSQEKLLEWWEAVQVTDTGDRIHDICLVEPLLLCNRYQDAQIEISTSFIHGIDAYVNYLEYVENGSINGDESYEQRICDGAKKKLTLWRWCIGRNHLELSKYIHENYTRNMMWIQKYGIPTTGFIQPRNLTRN